MQYHTVDFHVQVEENIIGTCKSLQIDIETSPVIACVNGQI